MANWDKKKGSKDTDVSSLTKGVKRAEEKKTEIAKSGSPNTDDSKTSKKTKSSDESPYWTDNFGQLHLRRQKLSDLTGPSFMSKWNNSLAARGSNGAFRVSSNLASDIEEAKLGFIGSMNRRSGYSGAGYGTRNYASEGSRINTATAMVMANGIASALKSADYRQRQILQKERADAFYELWKERYGSGRKISSDKKSETAASGIVDTPKKTSDSNGSLSLPADQLLVTKEAAKKQSEAKVSEALDAPITVTADVTMTSPTIGATSVIKDAETTSVPVPVEIPVLRREDGTLGYGFSPIERIGMGDLSGILPKERKSDMLGGYASLGSDGKYHRFSLTARADYKGGSTGGKQHGAVGSSTKFNFGPDPNKPTLDKLDKIAQRSMSKVEQGGGREAVLGNGQASARGRIAAVGGGSQIIVFSDAAEKANASDYANRFAGMLTDKYSTGQRQGQAVKDAVTGWNPAKSSVAKNPKDKVSAPAAPAAPAAKNKFTYAPEAADVSRTMRSPRFVQDNTGSLLGKWYANTFLSGTKSPDAPLTNWAARGGTYGARPETESGHPNRFQRYAEMFRDTYLNPERDPYGETYSRKYRGFTGSEYRNARRSYGR